MTIAALARRGRLLLAEMRFRDFLRVLS